MVYALGGGWASPGLHEVTSEGWNPYVQELTADEAKEIELKVVPAGRVEGRVSTAAGETVAGAVLQPEGSTFVLQALRAPFLPEGALGAVVTDAEGRYAIDALVPDGEYRLVVTAAGHAAFRTEALAVASGDVRSMDVVLPAARWFDVQVVDDATGEPLAGAVVRAASKRDTGWNGIDGAWTTDAAGRVRVGPLPRGVVGLLASAPGYVDARDAGDWEAVEGSESGATELEAVLRLTPGLAVAGRVVAPEGADPRRVEVTVQSTGFRQGRFVHERPALAADGTFRVDGLPEGSYEVNANLSWEGRRYAAKVRTTAGADAVDVVLEEAEAGSGRLLVRILDPDGEPVPSGRITFYSFQQGSSSSSGTQFSGGQADFDAPEEGWESWVEVYDVRGGAWGGRLVGPIDPSAGVVEIRLEPAVTIAGTVRSDGGDPVAGVRIEARAPHPRGDEYDRGNVHGTATTGTDGAFVIAGLGAGRYELRLRVPPSFVSPDPVEAVGGQAGVAIVLRSGAEATVTLLDWQGLPVPGAIASVGDTAISGRADAEGRARLRGLALDRTYTLSLTGPEGRDDLRPITLQNWPPDDTTVRFERAFTLRGHVVDPSGAPLAGVLVWHRMAGGENTGWSGVHTEEDGSFTLGELSEGEVELYAAVENDFPGLGDEPETTVVAAGRQDVRLTLDPGLSIVIRVRGLDDDTWWHHGTLSGPDGRTGFGDQQTNELDEDGRVVFRGLEAGRTYVFWMTGLSGGRYVLARDLRAGGAEVVVEPRVGKSITGRLLLPDGAENANVSGRSAEGIRVSGTVTEDGRFTIEGLPDGRYVLDANARLGEDWFIGRAELDAGGSVDITLAPR
jgi:hypothetical protein